MARNEEAKEMLLARHFDGEANPAEREAATRLLAEDPVLARDFRAVTGLGALLRAEVKGAAARVDFSRLADRVLWEAEARKKPSIFERVEEFLHERFGHLSQILLPGTVAAAAAGAALLLTSPHKPGETESLGPKNEFVITRVDSDNNWMSQTIDDEGTTILWIDDSEE